MRHGVTPAGTQLANPGLALSVIDWSEVTDKLRRGYSKHMYYTHMYICLGLWVRLIIITCGPFGLLVQVGYLCGLYTGW